MRFVAPLRERELKPDGRDTGVSLPVVAPLRERELKPDQGYASWYFDSRSLTGA